MSSVLVEVRAEYVVGTVMFLLRFFCRWRTRMWWWDDLFAGAAWTWFTLLYAMEEYLTIVGAAAAFTPAQRAALSPEMRASMRKGGIAMFASFYLLILLTWSLKGVLLCFFVRLTHNLRLQRYVWAVAAISVLSFFAAVLTETLHCLPIQRNWQVFPDPGIECSAGIKTNIVIAVGNVLTDGMLLAVPPLLMRNVKTPLAKKIKVFLVLSLGPFVMGMSLARCILTVSDPSTVNSSSLWAQREAIVAIFAVNAPVLNVLLARETWTGRRGTAGSKGYQQCDPPSGQLSGKKGHVYEMHVRGSKGTQASTSVLRSNASQEV